MAVIQHETACDKGKNTLLP